MTIARLKYGGGGDWYANPSAYPNLAKAARAAGLPVCDSVAVVEILDDNLFRYPFLCMTGHGEVHFTLRERTRLRAYLAGGGFLWADDTYGMDKSFRAEIAALYPENPLVTIPSSHAIYRSRTTLPGLPKVHEHDAKPAQGWGVYFDKRLVIYYSYSSDITDGMEDENVHNDGLNLHELALSMGVNLIHWFINR
ncbi:MAG: DUF4159 domain-containing protein [Chitinispirillaceae bacterium]|nr:DUF4159 domain-containing protein [Chitinispirillaceae bacterium]